MWRCKKSYVAALKISNFNQPCFETPYNGFTGTTCYMSTAFKSHDACWTLNKAVTSQNKYTVVFIDLVKKHFVTSHVLQLFLVFVKHQISWNLWALYVRLAIVVLIMWWLINNATFICSDQISVMLYIRIWLETRTIYFLCNLYVSS